MEPRTTLTRLGGRRLPVLLCVLVLTLTVSPPAAGQVGPGLVFLTVPSTGRIVGMAGSGSAIVDPTVAALNPGAFGVFSLQGTSGLIRNFHKQPEEFRVGAETNNTFVVGSYSPQRNDTEQGFRFALGAGFHRQCSDLGTIERRNEQGEMVVPVHIYELSNNFTVAGAVENGFEAGVGVTLKQYRSALAFDADAEGLLRDVGVMIRLPLHAIAERFDIIGKQTAGRMRFEIAVAASHVWGNRGADAKYSEAQQPDPPPRLRRFGLSAEGSLEYRSARLVRVLLCRDEEQLTDEYLQRNPTIRTGIEFEFLGIVRIQDGTYDSEFGGEDGASGYSLHLNGAWKWLDVLLTESANSPIPSLLHRIDAYYQEAELEGVPNLVAGGLGYREIGVTVQLFGTP